MLPIAFGADTAFAQSNSALRFFGTGTQQRDRVRIRIDDNAPGPDASTVMDLGAGSFSIDLWIRGTLADNRTANAGGDAEFFDFRWIDGNIVVDRDIWGASSRDWGVSIAGGFVRFGTGFAADDGEHTLEGNVNVLDGAWHHLAVVRDAATGVKAIYVDGMLDIASPGGRSREDLSYPNEGDPAPVTPWGPYVVIAAEKHDAGSPYPSFAGFVDEVRFWNVALTPARVADVACRVVAPDTPGLVGAYRFEEGMGQIVVSSTTIPAPTGELRSGLPGNGQWVLASANANNVAPLCPTCVADVDDGSGTGTPDGGVTIDDLLYYLFLFESGLLAADVDDGSSTGVPDGGVTIDDLLYYLLRFEMGC